MKSHVFALTLVCAMASFASAQKATIQGRDVNISSFPKEPMSISIKETPECGTQIVADYGECHVPIQINSKDAGVVLRFVQKLREKPIDITEGKTLNRYLQFSVDETLDLPIVSVEDFFPRNLEHFALRVTLVEFKDSTTAEQYEQLVGEALQQMFSETNPMLEGSDYTWKTHDGRGQGSKKRLYFFDEKGRPSVVENHPAPKQHAAKKAMETVQTRLQLLDALRGGITHETLRGGNGGN